MSEIISLIFHLQNPKGTFSVPVKYINKEGKEVGGFYNPFLGEILYDVRKNKAEGRTPFLPPRYRRYDMVGAPAWSGR